MPRPSMHSSVSPFLSRKVKVMVAKCPVGRGFSDPAFLDEFKWGDSVGDDGSSEPYSPSGHDLNLHFIAMCFSGTWNNGELGLERPRCTQPGRASRLPLCV